MKLDFFILSKKEGLTNNSRKTLFDVPLVVTESFCIVTLPRSEPTSSTTPGKDVLLPTVSGSAKIALGSAGLLYPHIAATFFKNDA